MNQNQTTIETTAPIYGEFQSFKVLLVLRNYVETNGQNLRDVIDALNECSIDYLIEYNEISQNFELLIPNSEFGRGMKIVKDLLMSIVNRWDRN
jgi:hypothetical protein